MKRLLTLSVACMLALCLGASAWADSTGISGSSDQDITVTYVEVDETEPVYSVDVQWNNDTNYIYTCTRMWDTDNLTYVEVGEWSSLTKSDIVSITNRSNIPVTVSVDFNPSGDFNGSVSPGNVTLEIGESQSFDFTLIDPPDVTENMTIGTITVSVT